jgi:hypothetical protein
LTFAVDVTVVESLLADFTVGDVIWYPNCYTLWADGTFDDPVFPDPTGPTPGTWRSTWDGTNAGFIAQIRADGLTLEVTGSLARSASSGEVRIAADELLVDRDDVQLLHLTSSGKSADACTPTGWQPVNA